MNTPDEFFQPEKIDEQIEQLRRQPLAGNGDAELIAYLQNVSATDATQERETLNRMWERVVNGTPGVRQAKPGKGAIISMQEQQTLRSNAPAQKHHSSRGRRWGILAAVLILTILVSSMTVIFNTLHRTPTNPNATGGKPSGASSPSVTANTARFQVTGVDMQVNPSSIAGMSCGANITVRYTATFHITPHSPGGTVHFEYTINNGRGSTPTSLTFKPGETTRTFSFTWSGNLPPDHTYPGLGGVITTSPNAINSQLISPTGQCN